MFGLNKIVTRVTCVTIACFLQRCGPPSSRDTHIGKQWCNKQQRRRDVNIGTTTASAQRRGWSLYWCTVTASPSVCMMMVWWADEWRWRHALMIWYFCPNILYHTHMVTRVEGRPDLLYKAEICYLYFLFSFRVSYGELVEFVHGRDHKIYITGWRLRVWVGGWSILRRIERGGLNEVAMNLITIRFSNSRAY